MAKEKKAAKPRKAPSKNHFKLTGADNEVFTKLGVVKGTQTDIENVKDWPDEVKFVGDTKTTRTGYNNRATKTVVTGIDVPVYISEKGIAVVPDCGDQGLVLTKETLAALNTAVQEHGKDS